MMKISTQTKALQAVIIVKQDQIEKFKQLNSKLTTENQIQSKQIQQLTHKIMQIEHSLRVTSENSEQKLSDIEFQMQKFKKIAVEEKNILIKKHQEEMLVKQSNMKRIHEASIQELKKANLNLLQKIQNDQKTLTMKSAETNKKSQSDYTRITTENTRLMTFVNELKLKVLDLESNKNTIQQQSKVLQKQTDILKDNYRKELEYLREQKNDLKNKNNRLKQKIDELVWEIREAKLLRQQQIKKMRLQVDHSFEQILEKAQQQKSRLLSQNQTLKIQYKSKVKEYKQMQQISLKIKKLFEQQQQQLLSLKKTIFQTKKEKPDDKQKLKYQNEEYKAQILKKNVQIKVLQDQIKRLKAKINGIASTYEEFTKLKELMQKQNKMLLSEIIFLRQKEKKGRNKQHSFNKSSVDILNDLNSQKSQVCQDIEQYKKLIQFMTEEMNEASKKIIQKDIVIQKLRDQIQRYENNFK